MIESDLDIFQAALAGTHRARARGTVQWVMFIRSMGGIANARLLVHERQLDPELDFLRSVGVEDPSEVRANSPKEWARLLDESSQLSAVDFGPAPRSKP